MRLWLTSASSPPTVQRMFGTDAATTEMAAKLGLPNDWAYQVIKQVGSYGEVFDRHLGTDTPFGLDRAKTPKRPCGGWRPDVSLPDPLIGAHSPPWRAVLTGEIRLSGHATQTDPQTRPDRNQL